VLGDLAALIPFSILLGVGISYRHRPAFHKRAMLLASIALVSPASARLAAFQAVGSAGPALQWTPLVLMLTLWVHDLLADRRLHATTAWGTALIFVSFLLASVLMRTEAGKAFVAAISLGG